MKTRNIISAIFICACLSAPLFADAYNNSIELRNDSPGAQYFSFRYRESYEKDPVPFYLESRNPDSWIVKADGSYTTGGSCNAVIWGIKAEYDHVDGTVEGTSIPYFKDKNIPSNIEIRPDLLSVVTREMEGFPEDYNVSRTFGNHQQDWDYLVAKKDSILDSVGLTADNSSVFERVAVLAEYCREVGKRPTAPEGLDYWLHPVDYLLHVDFCVGGSNAFLGLCAVMGIPVRTLRTSVHQWSEALIDGEWRYSETYPLRGDYHGSLFTFGFAGMMPDPIFNWYRTGVTRSAPSDAFVRYDLDASSQWRMYMPGGGGTRRQHSYEKPQMTASMGSAQEIGLLYSGTVTTVRTATAMGETGMWLNPPYHRQGSWKGWKKGRVDQQNGIQQRFYLSDTTGLMAVTSFLVLDSADVYNMPADGGDWYYSVNGNKYYLRDHGGWHLEPHPYSNQDSATTIGARCLVFSMPIEHLTTDMSTPVASRKAVSPIRAGRISMRSSASTIVFGLPFSGVQSATVHSLNGRVLAHAAIENNFLRIPRRVLSSGTYVLSVSGTQGMQTLRFAIQ